MEWSWSRVLVDSMEMELRFERVVYIKIGLRPKPLFDSKIIDE
jgi:hypothetical protein